MSYKAAARKLFKSPRVLGILAGILRDKGLPEKDLESLDYALAIEGLANVLEGTKQANTIKLAKHLLDKGEIRLAYEVLKEPVMIDEEQVEGKRLIEELRWYLRAALDWIDAVPSDVASRLPSMPGFDRDEAEKLIQ